MGRTGEALPRFLIIGAMKAGTTSLFHDLRSHPDVYFGPDKEPSNLAHDDVLSESGRHEYAAKYAKAWPGHVCGDASTAYSKLPDVPGVPDRALQVLGSELRIIYLVREPVARARSHHYHLLTRGLASSNFEATLEQFPELRDYGCYGLQLSAWADVYPMEQIKVLRFEDYIEAPLPVLAEVFAFLGLDPIDVVPRSAAHVSATTPTVTGSWARVRDNRVYRRFVRPLLSLEQRSRVKSMLISRPGQLPDPPLPETVRALQADFRRDGELLKRLLGLEQPMWPLDADLARD